jgi:hypothetical protein
VKRVCPVARSIAIALDWVVEIPGTASDCASRVASGGAAVAVGANARHATSASSPLSTDRIVTYEAGAWALPRRKMGRAALAVPLPEPKNRRL